MFLKSNDRTSMTIKRKKFVCSWLVSDDISLTEPEECKEEKKGKEYG